MFNKLYYLPIMIAVSANLTTLRATMPLEEYFEPSKSYSRTYKVRPDLPLQMLEQAQRDLENKQGAILYAVGIKYRQGFEVTTDKKKAFELINNAAKLSYIPAQYDLSVMYKAGIGTEPNLEEAYKWCYKAAQNGYAAAQNDLGCMYELGNSYVKCDKEQAIFWYTKAMEQGYELALDNLEKLLKEEEE